MAAALLSITLTAGTGCAGQPQRRGGPAAPVPAPAPPAAATRADPAGEISRFVAGLDGVGPGYAAAGATPARRSVGVSTLLMGDVALVGLDAGTPAARGGSAPDPVPGSADLGGMPGPAGLPLEDYIHGRVLTAFPNVKDVFVTTDPALVGRIARVSGRLQAGEPAEAHQKEIDAIARSLGAPVR